MYHSNLGYNQESFNHIFQSKPLEFFRYGRVKYNVDRCKESQMIGNQANQVSIIYVRVAYSSHT